MHASSRYHAVGFVFYGPGRLLRTRRILGRRCLLGALGLMTLLLVFGHALPAEGVNGYIVIGPATNVQDEIQFTFSSTWPAGVSYQAQFLRTLDGAWADVPDAVITPTGSPGEFLVRAPKFGGGNGFYRVLSSVSMPSDPIAETIDQPNPEEIVVLWSQASTNTVSAKLYFNVEATPGGAISNNILRAYPSTNSPPFNFGSSLPIDSSGAEDSLVTDLNGDGQNDPLFVWADPAGYINMAFAHIASSNFEWQAASTFHLTNLLVRPFDTVPPVLRLVAAHVDGDPNPEVVLAYTGYDGFVHIALLGFDSNLSTVTVKSQIADAALPFVSIGSLRDRSARFDIAAGDFDGDGLDQIALVVPEAITVPNGIENWDLYVRFYDYDTNSGAVHSGRHSPLRYGALHARGSHYPLDVPRGGDGRRLRWRRPRRTGCHLRSRV